MTLRERYPAAAKDAPTAFVSAEDILETLNHELLEVGSWLNIMGYLRPFPEVASAVTEAEAKRLKRKARKAVFVEATMVWSAGAVRLEKYEAALIELQEASAASPRA